ncbi:hypothetical protein H6F46_12040 [Limnothrix sp. FACHB-1083]|uniref:hypothetical protein n=1 Tax=unclassified Limnothrix TaxID=2632864 RepID=UPI0016802770|nr:MULTISPECIES: hypothetical protein [unclassified Limnothrix]MBD2161421.1 hypothetical protein [Limnothrix sp. FACHB-1083]MBD2192068.1 hypothetical protein [Limnothrix sp. FACHB-1088]
MSTPPPPPDLVQTIRDYAAEIAAVFGGLALIVGKAAEWRERDRAQKREFWDLQSERLTTREQNLIQLVQTPLNATIDELRKDLDREQSRVARLQSQISKLTDLARVNFERKEFYKHRYKVTGAQLLSSLRLLERARPGHFERQIAQIESELQGDEISRFSPPRFDPDRPTTEDHERR